MADGVCNISKGSFIEKFRAGGSNGVVLLLKTAEDDDTLLDYDTVAAMLAGSNTEADFTNYARRTGLAGTITVDDVNNRSDLDMADQTWSAAGGGTDNSLVKAIIAYQESAGDAGLVPIAHYDFIIDTDGGDLTLELDAAGCARAR